MGGFGAMSYAARHPDLFAAASSYSGALDIQNLTDETAIRYFPVIFNNEISGAIFGPNLLDGPALAAHNPVNLAGLKRIAMYTGNGLPGPFEALYPNVLVDASEVAGGILENTIHANNVTMDQKLTSLGIPHIFDDYGNGTHTYLYINRDLQWDLPGIVAALAPAK